MFVSNHDIEKKFSFIRLLINRFYNKLIEMYNKLF